MVDKNREILKRVLNRIHNKKINRSSFVTPVLPKRFKGLKKNLMEFQFVIIFNPALPNIPQVISSNLNILRSSQRCLEAFSSPPCISYHRRKNQCDILVRAKHRMQAPPHTRLRELSIVVTEIGARRVLLLQKEPRPTRLLYQRTKTSTTSHRITCSSSNLVYMIQCNKCNVHYVGESKRHLSIVNDLSDSFGEHRRAIEKAITKQHIDQPTAVSDHSNLPVHSMDNIKLVPLELITSNGDAIRKAREEFLSKTLESVIGKFTFCEKNKIISLPFLRQIFNSLSFIPKKQAHLSCVLEKTRVLCYISLRGKRKYQVTKLARRATFFHRIIEFKMHENHRKTPE